MKRLMRSSPACGWSLSEYKGKKMGTCVTFPHVPGIIFLRIFYVKIQIHLLLEAPALRIREQSVFGVDCGA